MPDFGSRGSISKIAMPDFGCAAPYPYSKMCELCELCELLERKIPPLSRWDFLIYPQQNLFVIFGDPGNL